MAELVDLGQACAHSDCRRLDFLPVPCSLCQQKFCQGHAFRDAHDCPQAIGPVVKGGPPAPLYPCSWPECPNRELVPLSCSECGIQICLAHRHQTDHGCAKYEPPQETMVQTQALVRAILAKSPGYEPKVPRNAKAQKLSARVQLMKLKMKSQGALSVPLEERLYFRVAGPRAHGKAAQGVFVSRQWCLGRVIDAVAQVCQVDNKNNRVDAPHLRLFRYQDGRNLCDLVDLGDNVNKLVEAEDLFNGDCLILEYLSASSEGNMDPKLYSVK
eukprot:snap_masked-scaffold349_size200065-processed-gene-1.16 protein:Tk10547 transcript:snap_masked-scaffold349_size200065-processed-gene-1.16-mRNA-1 annotation:"an1-type zinc finger protein 1 isoform 2"